MFLAHQSMLGVVIQHRVLVNLDRRTVEEGSVLRLLGGFELGLIVLINSTQVVELVWNVVGAFHRTKDARISSLHSLPLSEWRWRFGAGHVIVIVASRHMLHLILGLVYYGVHHLFCFLFHNAFTLSVDPGLVVKHGLLILVHQILSRLFTILQFCSKVHQSQLSFAVHHRFANFPSRPTSAPSFLAEVGRLELYMGWSPILNHQFFELLCFGIVNASVPRVFSRNKLRLECRVLHLHLFILLTHSITETFSFFILHESFAIELVADVVWVLSGHRLKGSQCSGHGLSTRQWLTRSIDALVPLWRWLLLHDCRFDWSLSLKSK